MERFAIEKEGLGDHHVSEGSSHELSAEHLAINERKLVLKIDLRILPILCIVYLMAFIDRVNIGNAQLFSLAKDLHLTTNQYNIALAVFFVSYIAFEIPANIIMKRVKPHIFMSSCMFCFGLLVTMQGFTQNFGGLITTRFLMGFAEAGVFPGCFYLMSMWYKRDEAQRRFSFFVSAATFAGAFGGLLATGIGHMDGIRGYHAWRWIFILEGIATCVLSIVAYFAVSDFPEEAKWLSATERAFVVQRLAAEQGKSDLEQKINFSAVLESLTDPKTLIAGFMYFGPTMSGYSLAYFIPTIVSTYGYTPIQAQLHSIPPWAAAFGLSMTMAYASDKTKRRFPFIIFNLLLALAGVITLFKYQGANNHARYGALCLYAMGVFSAVPIIICWFIMNLEGHKNRAVGSAWQIGFGNCAGFISTFAFPAKDKPKYETGYSLGIGLLSMSIVATIIYYIFCTMENKKRTNGQRKMIL
ncbi:MFS general substrate transporter [Ophiobolus disseminans]|uniref:MFS general substrate transporter n=1 Tax=Ophiobolus disseminans TaxID=1469910 RepID=A0A6A7AEP4_9PLEO|nr:MFS general substrate transporter [Ophiobolus disseminans]